jgi:uncharacterized membrane protein
VAWDVLFRARQYLRGSLWILPVIGGVIGALAAALVADVGTIFEIPKGLRYSAGTAEAVLAAVVAASVGLTGFVVTVSVLIVQMATGTFSARYMRLFYRDRVLKAVLAVLVGTMTFSYGLLRHVEENSVPHFGVTVAGFLLAAGVAMFLYFLDHSIHRLRPVAVAALVARAGRRAFEEGMRTAADGDAPNYSPEPYAPGGSPTVVARSARAGAIQAINDRGLVRIARNHDCVVVVPKAVGDFVPDGSVLVEVYGARATEIDERELRSTIALGVERTIEQDPAFAIRIMVDIAIRALSPAVNDPTTAVQVLGHLGETVRLVGSTPRPSRPEREPGARADVIVRTRRWEDVVLLATTEIRHYGGTSIQVVRRLRTMLEELRDGVLPERRPAIELVKLDATVAEHWGGSVDFDLAGTADRQGIGGSTPGDSTGVSPG